MLENPKMKGSNLRDCVPQKGPCPNDCNQCYYNRWFYAGFEPVVPTVEEAAGRIVRVNSGHDSNEDKEMVLEVTRKFPWRFYNTSQPELNFEGQPVVLTVNPRENDYWIAMENTRHLMYVRFRVHTRNISMAYEVIDYYTERNVPVVLTFMRYFDESEIPAREHYEERKHVSHTYWDIRPEHWWWVVDLLSKPRLVFTCGTPENPYCRDCGVCEILYWRKIVNLRQVMKKLDLPEWVNGWPIEWSGWSDWSDWPDTEPQTET